MSLRLSSSPAVAASMRPPFGCRPHDCPDSCSISRYRSIVYFCRREMLASPLKVCMPPAACQVDPEVSSLFSRSSTSLQPILARWYNTLAPTTPPPMTTALAEAFMR